MNPSWPEIWEGVVETLPLEPPRQDHTPHLAGTFLTHSKSKLPALKHKEGMAGLTFRHMLGVMLVYALIEVGLVAGIMRESQANRAIFMDWQVKRYA